MSVTINFSKNTSAPWQSNANMLKSTREKIQRQEERDGKIAFFETQKQNLKNQKADTIEEIAKKQNISRSGVFQNRHNSLVLMKKLLKEKQ